MSHSPKNLVVAAMLASATALAVAPATAQQREPSTQAFVKSLDGAQPRAVSFFRDLAVAAEGAKSAETDFRQAAAARISALEEERAFAFRRMNLMKAVMESVDSAESEETAVANAQAMLSARLGWNWDNELHAEVFAHFGPVARAAFRVVASGREGPVEDVGEELAAFETWYAQTWGAAFWSLFEIPMPDTPRVDF